MDESNINHVTLYLDIPRMATVDLYLVPQRELFGHLLLESKNPRLALTEFEASLAIVKNRNNSIAGAAKTAETIRKPGKSKVLLLEIG